jgi:riboflavin kinase/FMN adenylyltransferase
MRIFRNFEDAGIIRNPVVTTGSFDGVHIGHKAILKRLKMLADRYEGESVLITFDPHPRKVLYPETAGKELRLIYSQEEKLDLLEKAGLDNVIIVTFTLEFSRTTSEEFVRKYLHDILKAKVVVVGFNHHFGFNKEGDYRQLWEWQEKYHFEAEEIPEQEVYNETVSSTRIRQAISEGYIQRANAYLDHYYRIIGRTTEFSPAVQGLPPLFGIEITEESKLIPSPGIYAVSAKGEGLKPKGMVIISKTVSGTAVFVSLFDADLTTGKRLTIFFHKKIHGAVNLDDPLAPSRISHAREEISELIY